MKKRHFLLMGLGTTFALTVGWGVLPPRQRLLGKGLPLEGGQIALNAWLKLGADGSVVLAMPKSEMGQGILTALAMIVAEELGVALAAVRTEQSPIDRLYGNVAGLSEGIPFRPDDAGALARTARWTMTKVARELGIMMTGGSSSVKDLWLPLREAAAMTRTSLIHTLAKAWGVAAGSISLVDGVFSSGKQQMPLGDVIRQFGQKIEPAASWQLKAMQDFKLLGQPTLRRDAVGKTNGSAVFGIDAPQASNPQARHYAAMLMCPVRGGSAAVVDSSAALAMAGVRGVVTLAANINGCGNTGGVAVVAASYWQAKMALDALKVKWASQAASKWSNEQITQQLSAALATDDGFTYWRQGDAKARLAQAQQAAQATHDKASQPLLLAATYRAPYLAHATMEPMNATVSIVGRGAARTATLWVGTQVPDLVRNTAASVLGLAKNSVHVQVPFLGGGFGRRLEVDTAVQAASIAASHFGTLGEGSLQLVWSRPDDLQHDFYRPAAMAKFDAALDASGNITAWVNQSAGQHIVPQYFSRNVGLPMAGPDKTSSEGAFDQPYEFPAAAVSHVAVEMPIPVGFWRSVGHSHQAFFQESFLDECAQAALTQRHATRNHPITPADRFAQSVAYRRGLLHNHPRHLATLDLAVSEHEKAYPTPSGALGVALHESFGSIVAMVADVFVDADKLIRVRRITAAVDCGFCVNPAGVAQQVESNVAFGLSAALFGKIDFKDGQVQQSNFHDYRVLRMDEMPTVRTHIVPSTRAPEGVGEPALPPVAPAVACALFALTGQRLRELPLRLV